MKDLDERIRIEADRFGVAPQRDDGGLFDVEGLELTAFQGVEIDLRHVRAVPDLL